MKKILLLDTSVATQNVGDEIINDSIRMNWTELYDKNYICKYPTHTPPYAWWQQLIVSRKFDILANSDYKFLCGTNALYTNMMRPLPQWNIFPWNASFFKDTILLGVGAGINSRHINIYTKYLYKKVLSKNYIHSTRDEYTKNMLESLGYKAMNTGCPTLCGFTDKKKKKIPSTKSDKVLFTLTGYQPDIENDKLMVEILSNNYEELFFWPQTPTDLDYLRSIGHIDVKVITPNLCAYDRVLSDNNIDYVGNRLHGGIRALQHGRKSLIVAIDYRAVNMSKQYGLPIIEREHIRSKLDGFINSNFETKITGLDFDVIEKWKMQFEF